MRIWRLAILVVEESRISRGRGAADDLPRTRTPAGADLNEPGKPRRTSPGRIAEFISRPRSCGGCSSCREFGAAEVTRR